MAARVPVVFISSTCEDLKDYRLAARDAALNEGFLPDMLEYFTPGGGRPPVEEPKCRVISAAPFRDRVIPARGEPQQEPT